MIIFVSMRLSRYITFAAALMLLAGTTAYSQTKKGHQDYSFDRETGLVRTETGQMQCPEFARLLREDISRAGCNTNSFEFKDIHDTPAPKGFKPFYISHYGRHGSRSNWGANNYKRLADSLQRAKDAGLLTASGDSLLSEALQVYTLHDGMDGRLTPRGCYEHKMLARRLYNRYPKVFKQKGYEVRARSSTVQRCIVSMTAFTNELTAIDPKMNISWDTGETFMKYISNGASDRGWKKVRHLADSVLNSYHVDSSYVMRTLFTDSTAARKFVPNIERFEHDIFRVGAVADAFELEHTAFRFLPFDALYKWFEHENIILFLANCNYAELVEDRMRLTEPLVNDLVTKADEAIAGNGVAADLRFGHDYPFEAMVTYLGYEGIGDRLTLDEARSKWFGAWMIPFAGNMEMVFYRNKAGKVLVKFLLNEQETLLRGLPSVEGPYYDWETVKANLKGYLR